MPRSACPTGIRTMVVPVLIVLRSRRGHGTSASDWSFPSGANFTDCVEDIWRLLHPLPSASVGKRVVYMHCGGGTDRTGSLVLGFRLALEPDAVGGIRRPTRHHPCWDSSKRCKQSLGAVVVRASSLHPARLCPRLRSNASVLGLTPGPPAPTPSPHSGVAVCTVVSQCCCHSLLSGPP